MTCVNCPSCGAALALQDSGTNRHTLALNVRLSRIVQALPHLSDQMLRIVEAVCLQLGSRDSAGTCDAAEGELPRQRERAIDLSGPDFAGGRP